ncbi:hypothetical protein [Salinibacillus kushneri]|uniref:hypothetical protein n=1 Tax=Salinibacillus kushneri TaxID=237682 RepID=UPI000B8A2F20|nr:hypothetical protein [Salinibacillus kushneri]
MEESRCKNRKYRRKNRDRKSSSYKRVKNLFIENFVPEFAALLAKTIILFIRLLFLKEVFHLGIDSIKNILSSFFYNQKRMRGSQC